MSVVITPAISYDTASVITAPEDGDDLDAAVIETDLQVLANRARLSQYALGNYLAGDGAFGVRSGGTLTSFTIDVGAIHLATLVSGTVTGVYDAAATTVTEADIEGGGGTLGAVARWWYVYAYAGSGIDYQVSQTAPAAGRRCKSGATTHTYLGCFRTTAAGAPLPGRKSNGRWVYRRSALSSNETRVLNTSAAAGATDLDLSALVPPHARLATLSLSVTGGDGFCGLTIFTDGDTSDATLQARAEAGVTTSPVVGDVETSAAQVVDRVVTFGGTTGTAVAHVHGFYE